MENEELMIKNYVNNENNAIEAPKSVKVNLNEFFSSENPFITKSNSDEKLSSYNAFDELKIGEFSRKNSSNLRSNKNSDMNIAVDYLQKRNSIMPNKNQINSFNSIVRKSCFTKFDVKKFEKKQSQYIDEEIFQNHIKSKQEKEQIRKELIKDLFRRFGKTKKIKSLKLKAVEEQEILEAEQNKKEIEFNFKNLFLYRTEVLSNFIQKSSVNDIENNPIADKKNSNIGLIKSQEPEEIKVEEDDGVFLKKKIQEIQAYAENEKQNQDRRKSQLLQRPSKVGKKERFSFTKKVSIFIDSGKYKNKWFSKMTEDEYDDFINKTKSENLQKLSKLRSNKKAKELDFEGFLREKSKPEKEKENKSKSKKTKLDNNDKNNIKENYGYLISNNKDKNNAFRNLNFYNHNKSNNYLIQNKKEDEYDEIEDSSENRHEKSLDKIHEESKSSRFSAFEDLTANENFKNILNAQSMHEKELSASYIFASNNVLMKKENEDQLYVCASKTISKNKSKNTSNGTALVAQDISKNSINLPKKNPDKSEKTKNRVEVKNKSSNPLKLIKFEEKDQTLLASMYGKRVKPMVNPTQRELKSKGNEADKNLINIKSEITKSKYTEKKEKLANYKKFEKLKKLSNLVANVKSTYMRNLKIDFIIHQQNEKENKERLIHEYLEEENKIMESNNIENENHFEDENHITWKNNREVLKFVRYKDTPKLDSAMLQNTIYQSNINRINFLQDSYLIPDLRNRFIRYPDNCEEILVDENLIEKFSKLFLNYNKQIYQKELDDNKKLEEVVKENKKLNESIEISGESNFIKSLRNRKNEVFQENYKKYRNRNYEYLNSFKFKYNRKKFINFANEQVENIIENVYEVNMFEKEDNRLMHDSKTNTESKMHSEDFCLSNNGNNREESLHKFFECYGIDVE